MDLVVPMAGLGTRTASLWNQPKPFIDVGDHPLLAHALKSVESLRFNQIIFVANQAHQSFTERVWPQFSEEYLKNQATTLCFTETTKGQAHTVLVGISKGRISEDFIVIPCDTAFSSNFHNSDFVNSEGAMGVFRSDNPNLSFALVDSEGHVTRTAEKEVISNKASSGLYYFSSPELFCHALEFSAHSSESFIAPIYNYIIKAGGKVRALDHEWVTPLGTANEIQRVMGDGILVEKLKSRFKN